MKNNTGFIVQYAPQAGPAVTVKPMTSTYHPLTNNTNIALPLYDRIKQ